MIVVIQVVLSRSSALLNLVFDKRHAFCRLALEADSVRRRRAAHALIIQETALVVVSSITLRLGLESSSIDCSLEIYIMFVVVGIRKTAGRSQLICRSSWDTTICTVNVAVNLFETFEIERFII